MSAALPNPSFHLACAGELKRCTSREAVCVKSLVRPYP
jgi:hypothetical protein